MVTKYDIGDLVTIPAKIDSIEINKDNEVFVKCRVIDSNQIVTVKESVVKPNSPDLKDSNQTLEQLNRDISFFRVCGY